jgi:cytochrome c peroxidase
MASWKNNEPKVSATTEVKTFIIQELTSLNSILSLSKKRMQNLDSLKSLYLEARRHYKHCEFFIEYFSPYQAKYFINGPLVPKHDAEIGNVMFEPQGFQRIEELLFDSDSLDKVALLREYLLLENQITELATYYPQLDCDDGKLLEMLQLELIRVAAMNLNGYDASIIQNNITETLWSLQGIEQAIRPFVIYTKDEPAAQRSFRELKKLLNHAKRSVRSNTNYESFNRLQFITKHIIPINRSLVSFHNTCDLPWNTNKAALNLNQESLFGEASFNKRFFSIYYNDTLNLDKQAALGEKLFYDPILSGSNRNSCASCHKPEMAFTDGRAKSKAIGNNQTLSRNAPTLLNVIYQKAFFHDGRAYQLEQQVFDVIHNQDEMGSSLDDAIFKLRENANYRALFKVAFSGTVDTSITHYAVQKAITEYEKTLITFNSRFDHYLQGNFKSLNKAEIDGYNLFAGKALCGSCHFFPLFNGTVPPFYKETEFEVIGTPESSNNNSLDSDLGRFKVTGIDKQKFAFKTPTVRNVELTAPYMHNGVYSTLEEVVEFYHKGGGAGLGFTVPNQTLPFDSLKLSPVEKHKIILFMKTLTEKERVSN